MDWTEELMIALTIYAAVKKAKQAGATGEVDLDMTLTVKATGLAFPIPTIPLNL